MINVTYPKHIALLIDAENIQRNFIEDVLKISAYFGELIVCDAYADWSKLSTWREKFEALGINCQQVEHLVKKDDVDDRIKIDIGRLLADSSGDTPFIEIFVLVSGDKGFSTPYERIQKHNRKLIIIGGELSPEILQKSCDDFYYLHELNNELQELEKQYPIHPKILRQVFRHLEMMFAVNFENPYGGLNYHEVDKQVREKLSNSPANLGSYQLSECLKYFGEQFEQRGERILVNPHLLRRMALSMAYGNAKQEVDLVSLALFDNFLRESASKFSLSFYKTYFHGKKLSEWLEMYRDMFEVHEDLITLVPNRPSTY